MRTIVNNILKRGYLSIGLKLMSLIAFGVLLWSGFSASSPDSDFLIQLRNTNLGNLVVWSLWWPMIIIAAILFGRVWCMVCPMELITTLCAKVGLRRKPSKFLASGWVITIFYFTVLLLGIQAFAIHRDPTYMAIYMLSIALLSVIVGLIFEKNTFCRYACPIGLLLGLYSKLSIFGLRVKRSDRCATCKDKSCIDKKYRYRVASKSCGVGLYPAKIESNSNCILCGGCVRSCSNYQAKSPSTQRPNPTYKRTPFASGIFTQKALSWAEVAFLIMLSGFVISEVWTEWGVTKEILNSISAVIIEPLAIEIGQINKVIHGVVIFILLPLLFWFLPFLVAKLAGSTLKIADYLKHYSLSFIPIVAAAHFTKAMLKSTSRFDYYKHLASDINGIDTAQQIIDGQIVIAKLPTEVNALISVVTIAAITLSIWLSFRVISKLNRDLFTHRANNTLHLIPLLYGAIFLVMMVIWRV